MRQISIDYGRQQCLDEIEAIRNQNNRDVGEDKAIIATLVERGLTDEQIQAVTGLSSKLISQVRRRTEIREELKTATLAEVGARHGLTHERIRQIAELPKGALVHQRRQRHQAEVVQLFHAGLDDEQIAERLSIDVSTVRSHRLRAGIKRPNPLKKWDKRTVLEKLRQWVDLYGFVPAAADWTPALALQLGHTQRVERLVAFRARYGCPTAVAVANVFGSWLNMIHEAGMTPAPKGAAAIGRFSDHQIRRPPGWRPELPDTGWSKELVLSKAIAWHDRYGCWPRASDWNVWKGQKDYEVKRARFDEIRPPYAQKIYQIFGSFEVMIRAAQELIERRS